MLRQVYGRPALNHVSYNSDIFNIIVESECRRKNSYFSRIPYEVVQYLKPFVRWALCPRVRYAVLGDPVYPSIPIKRTIAHATFGKCMGWVDNRLDMPFIFDQRYYSTYDNCRGVKFTMTTEDPFSLIWLNGLLGMSAATIECLLARITITIAWRYLEGGSTFVDIRMKPPLGSSTWPDKKMLDEGMNKRTRELRAMDMPRKKPQLHYMKNFNIRKY